MLFYGGPPRPWEASQGKVRPCEVLLAHAEHLVGLVFPWIDPAQKVHAPILHTHPRVMPGGHVLRAKPPGAVDQVAKLQLLIA